jgi:predicted metalloendopeptidase
MISRLARLSLGTGLCACAFAAVAALDVAGLDPAGAACADFYRYANGRWLESTRVPDNRSRWGTFDQIDEHNQDTLGAALDRGLRGPLPPRGTAQRMAMEVYASGMDRDAIEKAGTAPIAPQLALAAKVDGAGALARVLGRLHESGIKAGFTFAVRPDARDSTRYLAQVAQGGLGLPDRDYYFLDDARSAQIREAYRKHVERMLALAGDGEADASRNAAAAIALETELARASMTGVERRDVDKTYNPMTPAQLAVLAPGFPWKDYFEAIGAGTLARVNVEQPQFMGAFAGLAASRYPAEWRAYLRWQVVRATADKLPRAFARAHFEFYEAVLRGRQVEPPRMREVIDIIGGRTGTEPMGQALSRVYIENAFTPEAKARAQALVGNVKAALAERLASVDWMSEDTRKRALEKLAAMRVKIAYPDRWRDYAGADVGPYPFVDNWLRANAYVHRLVVSRIGKPVDRDEWFTSPHITNAFYNRNGNEIVFPAGILQPPFFDPAADDAVNYGAIGAVIGHEITHGFDDGGRRFDAAGNMTDWWTAEDARRYVERAQRVERQYGAFVGVEDIKVNGKLTLGENISDIGGLKIAYLALQKALAGKPREKIDGLTPEQRFFLSFAEAWRSIYRPELERLQLRTDPHSPPRFRVAGVLANMPEFAQAFGCDATHALLSEGDRANIW